MDILKIARLIEDLSRYELTRKEKTYMLHEALENGIITADDEQKLLNEYTVPERCDDPWDHRYTIVYYGYLFDGDIRNDYNEIGCGDLAFHWDWITDYGQHMEITIYDNEYDVIFDTITEEWH